MAGLLVWGFTAGLLDRVLRLAGWEQPWDRKQVRELPEHMLRPGGGSPVNWLDLLLLVSAASFAFSGYRQGFVVGVLAFAGFFAGGVAGLLLAPTLVSGVDPGLGQSVLAIAVVLLCATIGQLVLAWIGSLVRDRLTWRPARLLDAGMGALVSVMAMLLVTWFLASALRPGPVSSLSRQISDSQVITAVDDVVPEEARTLFSSFRRVLDDNGLPTVFGGLAPERIRPVDPPSGSVTATQAVRRAGTSVVKVTGTAADCNRRLDGSGFVMSDGHVLTNAHVVAGVDRPEVQVGGDGRSYAARVVVFDPDRDLAVLYAPDLPSAPLAARRRRRARRSRRWSRASRAAARTGSSRPASATRSTRAARTSTTASRSPARCSRSTRRSSPATPAGRCSTSTATCTAWCSPSRSTTRTPATP